MSTLLSFFLKCLELVLNNKLFQIEFKCLSFSICTKYVPEKKKTKNWIEKGLLSNVVASPHCAEQGKKTL